MYLVPAAGLNVIDPANGQPLPPEGKEVADTTYWRRRLAEGDVTEGSAQKKSKSKE